jgi:hypothetical protein
MAFEIESPSNLITGDPTALSMWLSRFRNHVRGFSAVRTITAVYNLEDSIGYVRGDATGGAIVLNLPPAVKHIGRHVYFKKIDASGNAVTLTAAAGDTIEGAATLALAAQWAYAHLVAGASGSWEKVT